MSKDIEKYTNWRVITESDYVTMFIKTWFAFVAVLRKLYPDISVFTEDGKPRGDRPFTNKFKNETLKIISAKIDSTEFAKILSKIYVVSRHKVAKNLPQYFLETFYRINEEFYFEDTFINYTEEDDVEKKKIKDRTKINIKIEKRFNLSVSIQVNGIYNKSNYNENVNLNIKFKDIIDSIDLKNNAYVDELGYLQIFYGELYNRIQQRIYLWMSKNLQNKYTEAVTGIIFSKIVYCATKIREQIYCNFNTLYQNSTIPENSYLILRQRPVALFSTEIVKNSSDEQENKYINQKIKEDIFFWFIDFVVSLRNALFHEIIDPLDKEWQLIFKNSYLALKEILDFTINYLTNGEES